MYAILRLRGMGFKVRLDGEHIKVRRPENLEAGKEEIVSALMQELRTRKPDVVAWLRREAAAMPPWWTDAHRERR